jgi:PHD/YefM family antitoxin component YafN of YafNO toxin-antitoxin module
LPEVTQDAVNSIIILSLSRYQKLMEDLHDLAVVAERRAETSVSLSEMKRRLKKDGIR